MFVLGLLFAIPLDDHRQTLAGLAAFAELFRAVSKPLRTDLLFRIALG